MTTPVQQLATLLRIRYPIIQAPMAGGITTPSLVAATSDAGGLGSFGAAYMSPDELTQAIRTVRSKTSAPYQVNLFVPVEADQYESERHTLALRRLSQIYESYGIEFSSAPTQGTHSFDDQLCVVIEERVPIVSFTFGIPSKDVLAELRRIGSVIMGTATCVAEGQALAEAKFDVVVAQGFEAGGHRATFHSTLNVTNEIPNIGLFALLPQMVRRVSIPVVASGGIMNGGGIVAAIALGAAGCQLGTAFMGCPEAQISPSWRNALTGSVDTSTSLTGTFSGRLARGVRNGFMADMDSVKHQVPPFPIQNALTGPLRREAKRRDDANYQALWSGQAAQLMRGLPAAELIGALLDEVELTKRDALATLDPLVRKT